MDLGRPESCGAFRIQVGAGWPWWDALKGEIKDQVERADLRSTARIYQQPGLLQLRTSAGKIFPANHFWPDDETLGAHLFELEPRAS